MQYAPSGVGKVTSDYLQKNVLSSPTHVVILGAGASKQAFPNGDANGLQLPTMADLIQITGVKDILLREIGETVTDDFEAVYSRLASDPENIDKLKEIKNLIRQYFAQMQLPEEPTLYDHLLLSLRNSDLVATFNWDPLLFDCWERLCDLFGEDCLPSIAYLHGNVRVACCYEHYKCGPPGLQCPLCNRPLEPTPLLLPVEDKNYDKNRYTRDAKQRLQYGLEKAFAVTIFGYGAPRSDKIAIDLMKSAWNGRWVREYETISIVNTENEDKIKATWRRFTYGQHFRIRKDFYDTMIPQYARRSIEALYAMTIEGCFVDLLPIPRDGTWEQLSTWLNDMTEYEVKPE